MCGEGEGEGAEPKKQQVWVFFPSIAIIRAGRERSSKLRIGLCLHYKWGVLNKGDRNSRDVGKVKNYLAI